MKKILILSEFTVTKWKGGTNRLTFEVAKNLIKKGCKVKIISPSWNNKLEKKYFKEWTDQKIEIELINLPMQRNPILRTLYYFLYGLKGKHDAVITFYTLAPAIAACMLPVKRKTPMIIEPTTIKSIKSWQASILKKADTILTLTNTAKEMLESKGIKSTVVPGFVDTKKFYPLKNKKKGLFTIGFVGRFRKLKGFPVLLEAFKKLKSEEYHLVATGNSVPEEKFKEEKNMEFFENLSDTKNKNKITLPDLYRRFDVFVLPSKSEGFGLVLAEAMATGLPCIVSNNLLLKEVVGNAGIPVNEDNPDEIAEKIKLLKENKKLYFELSQNAIKQAQKYEIRKVMDKFYKEIVGG